MVVARLDKELIRELQFRQFIHDEMFHQDIAYLPPAGRVKHYILHLTKYAAQFRENLISQTLDSHKENIILVDTFAILMSAANALKHLYATPLLSECTEPLYTATAFSSDFIKLVGRLSKQAEELDHSAILLGTFNSITRTLLEELWQDLHNWANQRHVALIPEYHKRLSDIRQNWFLAKFQIPCYVDRMKVAGVEPVSGDVAFCDALKRTKA